jgi:ATP-dependent RNA helicase RhlB
MKFLLGILERENPESAIIFCNTKKYTEIVARRLDMNGIACEFIMGDLPQSRRLRIIEDVKAGKTRFLVATDVAARGLDIDDLAMVINYDLPAEAENYVHRIGRTARAGKTGKAVSLASEQDVYELPAIERYIGKKIPSTFADESLLGEDKSAGLRIRIDSYDDRGRRDDRRHDSRGRDNRRTGPLARRGEGRRREGSPAVSPRRSGPKPRTERPRGETGAAQSEGNGALQRTPRRRETSELASLSQEERMAYYKQQYETPNQRGSSGQKPGGGRQPRESGNRRNRGRQHTAQRPGQSQQPGQRTQQAPAAPQEAAKGGAKKGLLSKILGIFRKG